ncbi:16293_t:CDS:2 [Racocetra fulgida]|uniref:16293_t:CDS:1 n=1 Tax=Racocetra fulgida TaxID=60492 RepID=A0A9N9AP76_9GLOM|nr:16293_t:CDS:2 [Racocetra fulgida]
MKLLHTIDTSPNPNGDYLLAYPSPIPSPSSPFSNHSTQHTAPSGDVLIFDALSLQVVNVVQAHKSPVAYVAINSEGTFGPNSNANANNGATNGAGGVANSLTRHSIGPATIGGFEAFIDGKKKTGSVGAIRRQSLHLGRTVAGSVGNYLPDALTEMWEPTRDFAYLKLPSSGVQSVVALSK